MNDEKRMQRADSLMNAWSYGRVKMDGDVRDYYKSNPGIPSLDGSYTIFGEVSEGLDIIDRIQAAETDKNDRPIKDITITKATVISRKDN